MATRRTVNKISLSVLAVVLVVIVGSFIADSISKSQQAQTAALNGSPRPTVQPSSHAKTHHHSHKTRPLLKASHRHRPSRPDAGVAINQAGVVLPSPARTPGATNPAVTQATIGSTICVSGWTSTVRPPSTVTTSLKEEQLATGYAYRGDTSTADYEEDHLISLELGGSPASPANLWPEPYGSPEGARVKDAIENKLHALVCGHSISLATAQHAIATNWWAAYQKYEGTTATD